MKELLKATLITSTLLLSLAYGAQAHHDKASIRVKESNLEKRLDNLCGDTWCEGVHDLKSIKVKLIKDTYHINMVNEHETGAIIQTFCQVDSEKIDDNGHKYQYEDFFKTCLEQGLDLQTKAL